MINAAIFDLDGTLVDTNDLHAESWQEAFRHFGKEIPMGDLRRQIGKGADQYLPVFLNPAELREIGKPLEEFRADLYKKKFLPRAKAFPRVRDLFERLHAEGKMIALATSGKEQELERYCALARIEGLVDAETTADDVEHSKPEPDIFVAALRALGDLPADEVIEIGDTPYDVEAANKAQLRTIGLLCGGFSDAELRRAGAIAIFRDPADLLNKYASSPLADAGLGSAESSRDAN